MSNAELIEVRLYDPNEFQYSFLVNCDFQGKDLLDIISEELAGKSDGWSAAAIPFSMLDDDGVVPGDLNLFY